MKQYIIAVACIVAIMAALVIALRFKTHTSYGTVIILNGPSSAGKSSIQKEFQASFRHNFWIKLGIDNLFDKPMPDITMENLAFWQSENPIRWVESSTDAENNTLITLFTGVEGDKVAYGMNSAIAAYAHAGCNVIVDYIAYKKEWADDLVAKLKGVPTHWVKVEIPLTVLEEREAARGTSPKGHARSHYNTVHWDIKYDLVVNSADESPSQIARKIKDAFKL